jgi:non-homologous end joining protein Ku
MQEQIDAKVAGQEIVAEPTAEPETQIIDLMEALKASLASSKPSAKDQMKAVRGKREEKPKTNIKRKAASG